MAEFDFQDVLDCFTKTFNVTEEITKENVNNEFRSTSRVPCRLIEFIMLNPFWTQHSLPILKSLGAKMTDQAFLACPLECVEQVLDYGYDPQECVTRICYQRNKDDKLFCYH
jgi:hypothetical protein